MNLRLLKCQIGAMVAMALLFGLEAYLHGKNTVYALPAALIALFMMCVSLIANGHYERLKDEHERLKRVERLPSDDPTPQRLTMNVALDTSELDEIITRLAAREYEMTDDLQMSDDDKAPEQPQESVWETLKNGGLLP